MIRTTLIAALFCLRLYAGSTIIVPAGGDLQSAINAAQPGDTVALTAGATYTGNFTLPEKFGDGFVVITTSQAESLPPSGTRITRESALALPKIVTPNSEAALRTIGPAHHYRLKGLEIGSAPGVAAPELLRIGTGLEREAWQLPHHLIVEQFFINGDVALNGAVVDLIDSYVERTTGNGAGPVAILNSDLADTAFAHSASEIVVLGNRLPKPMEGSYPLFAALNSNLAGGTFKTPAITAGPASGSGTVQSFSFVFANSPAVTAAAVQFSPTLASTNACSLVYDATAGTLQLLWDNAQGSDTRKISSTTTLQNSQCAIGASQVSSTSQVLTLTVAVTFKTAFAGTQNIYGLSSTAAANTGWQTLGTWTVPPAVAVNPLSGLGLSQTFTFSFANQQKNLTDAAILFAPVISSVNVCYVVYDVAANSLQLLWDSGMGSDSKTVAAGAALQNSQCRISAPQVATSGQFLNITLTVTFRTAFYGAKNTYALAATKTDNSGWQTIGTWTVPPPPSVSPATGTGAQQTFNFVFPNQNPASAVAMLFSASASALTNACYLVYDPKAATIQLLWDNAANSDNKQIGSAAALQNSQCAVGFAQVSTVNQALTVTVNLVFTSAFAGTRNVYVSTGAGWQPVGSWTVLVGASVSPASGSGPVQPFSFTFPNFQQNISAAGMLFSHTTSYVNACYVVYDRTAQTLQLLWDNAQGSDTITVGSGVTLQNSHCSIQGSYISSTSQTVTVELSVVFANAFAGNKNIYASYSTATTNTGLFTVGTWTVPAPISVSPASGTGVSQTFSFGFPTQLQPVTSAAMLFAGPELAPGSGCFIIYDGTANTIQLNDSFGEVAAGPAIPSTVIQDGACSVTGVVPSATSQALLITLTVTFSSSFTGQKDVSALVPGGNWLKLGTWTIPSVTLSPTSGAGTTQNFTFTFPNQNSVTAAAMLFAPSLAFPNTCFVVYDATKSTLQLLWDNAMGSDSRSVLSNTVLQNSQCSLGQTLIITTPNSVAITVSITFKPAFNGAKNSYALFSTAVDNSGWQNLGTWTVQ